MTNAPDLPITGGRALFPAPPLASCGVPSKVFVSLYFALFLCKQDKDGDLSPECDSGVRSAMLPSSWEL